MSHYPADTDHMGSSIEMFTCGPNKFEIINRWFSFKNWFIGRDFEVWKMLGVRVRHRDWLDFNNMVIDDNIQTYKMK